MAVQNNSDPLGAPLYIVIVVGGAVVFLTHLIWLARFRNVSLEATSAGLTPHESATASPESVTTVHASVKDSRLAQSLASELYQLSSKCTP